MFKAFKTIADARNGRTPKETATVTPAPTKPAPTKPAPTKPATPVEKNKTTPKTKKKPYGNKVVPM